MAADRIVFIRHAEAHGAPGVTDAGHADEHSLTVRGWQRAGALARFLAPVDGGGELRPDAVFASRIGKGSETRRPQQTVSPLVAMQPALFYDTAHLKTEVAALMSAVLSRSGTVLVAWEHSMISKCVALLPQPPDSPEEWPESRYDLCWICTRTVDGWSFAQRSQLLLAGDA